MTPRGGRRQRALGHGHFTTTGGPGLNLAARRHTRSVQQGSERVVMIASCEARLEVGVLKLSRAALSLIPLLMAACVGCDIRVVGAPDGGIDNDGGLEPDAGHNDADVDGGGDAGPADAGFTCFFPD